MASSRWRQRDPLYRGDDAAGVAVPDPSSTTSVVPHILYLGGRGRLTPYTSTTESKEVGAYFAGHRGTVWLATASGAVVAGAKHRSQGQLLQDLRGRGKGNARWSNSFEVAQAASYVEQWSEHLLDWSDVPPSAISLAIGRTFRNP